MTPTTKMTTLGLLAILGAGALAPAAVRADDSSTQKNKNQWRDLGIAGAVIAGYGLLNHNNTATVLGAAGAAYSASRYEKDRRSQSQDNNRDRRQYYHNTGNGYGYNTGNGYGYNNSRNNGNNGYNNGYGNNNNGYGYNNGGYNNSGYSDNGYGNNSYGNNSYGNNSYGSRHTRRHNHDDENDN